MTDYNPVSKPKHYNIHPSGVECIEITANMSFCIGNAFKYIWRADIKGNATEDLRKARWYLERELQDRVGLRGKSVEPNGASQWTAQSMFKVLHDEASPDRRMALFMLWVADQNLETHEIEYVMKWLKKEIAT